MFRRFPKPLRKYNRKKWGAVSKYISASMDRDNAGEVLNTTQEIARLALHDYADSRNIFRSPK